MKKECYGDLEVYNPDRRICKECSLLHKCRRYIYIKFKQYAEKVGRKNIKSPFKGKL